MFSLSNDNKFPESQGTPQIDIRSSRSIKNATAAKQIYQIVSKAFDQESSKHGYLNDFLSKCDKEGNPIRVLISQKLSEIDKKNNTLARINVLMSYISQEDYGYTCFPIEGKTKNSLSRWIKDCKKPDLSKEEVDYLLKYISPNSSKPYFSSSNDFLKEFYSLLQSESLHTPFAGFKIKANKEGNCPHALLHYAIQARKSNIAHYLLHIGANSNSVNKSGNSAIMEAFQAITVQPQQEIKKSFFSDLLKHRKPIQEIELFHLLDLCCHRYKPDDSTHNLRMFDEAISLLLGCKQSVEKYFENGREIFLKYVAHINHIKGIHENKDEPDVKLTGLHKDTYIQFRLRLLLQIIVESVSVHQGTFSTDELSMIYEEFLVELEMSWITQLLCNWRNDKFSSNEEKTKRFCQLLSKYVFKQIARLQPGKEYPLHVGWPGHSICVVKWLAMAGQNLAKLK